MNYLEFSALRRHLFFTQAEAAEQIGGVNEKKWQQWETGKEKVPNTVLDELIDMLNWRQHAVDSVVSLIEEHNGNPDFDGVDFVWYATMEEFSDKEPLDAKFWRPHQSVCAELVGFGINLINSLSKEGKRIKEAV